MTHPVYTSGLRLPKPSLEKKNVDAIMAFGIAP